MGQNVQLLLGDCVVRMRGLPAASVDEIVSDPPYGLRFMSKDFDDLGDGAQQRLWHKDWCEAAYHVLKPGGHVQAFSGTRTFHHMAHALVAAGFELVGLESWAYGSGFPKSMNVSKQLDKQAGAVRESKQIPHTGNGMMRHGGENTRPWIEEALKTGFHTLPGDKPVTEDALAWNGWGTALKPAWEPVLIARKPL
jgi:site-specific DNA-methyltransferase (adenine-specific)